MKRIRCGLRFLLLLTLVAIYIAGHRKAFKRATIADLRTKARARNWMRDCTKALRSLAA